MTFSYQATHASDIDRVRFYIADTASGNGPLPEDGNFTNEEIQSIIALEGAWQRAVAACFERLASAWRKFPNLESDQFGLSRSHISRGYEESAASWRREFGYGADAALVASSSGTTRSYGSYRTDGFGTGLVGEEDAF